MKTFKDMLSGFEEKPVGEEIKNDNSEKPIKLKKDGSPRKNNAGRNPLNTSVGWQRISLDVLTEHYQFFLNNRCALGGTWGAYISRLISADLEVNREKYEYITDQINNMRVY